MPIKKMIGLVLVPPVLLALCLADQLAGGASAQEEQRRDFAFVNIGKVLRNHKEIAQFQREFNELKNSLEAEIEKELDEIKKLKEELMVFTSNSDDYLKRTEEIERKELGINQKRRTLAVKHNNRLIQQLKDSYVKIEKAVSEFAATRGIKNVLTYSYSINDTEFEQPQEVLDWIQDVDVICHDPQSDITDEIIKIING